MPADNPDIVPVVEPIVIFVAGLLHVPMPEASVNVVEDIGHTLSVPDMEDGTDDTVTVAVAIQPVFKVYVIVVVPKPSDVTKPVPVPTLATPELELVHVPPAGRSDNKVVPGLQIIKLPVIVDGNELTVATVVAMQPVDVIS